LVEQAREYNNPLILEKFIEEYGIDEIGSNYPREIYTPHKFEEGDFFESLAVKQTELLQA
jgi:hypothetical protein